MVFNNLKKSHYHSLRRRLVGGKWTWIVLKLVKKHGVGILTICLHIILEKLRILHAHIWVMPKISIMHDVVICVLLYMRIDCKILALKRGLDWIVSVMRKETVFFFFYCTETATDWLFFFVRYYFVTIFNFCVFLSIVVFLRLFIALGVFRT